MDGTFRVGRVAGFTVRAHWTVLLIAGLVAQILADEILPASAKGQSGTAYWSIGFAVALLFIASLLVHELSHAVVARRRGIVVKDITLWMLGGVTVFETQAHEASTALRVALIGPLSSAFCGVVSLGAAALNALLNGPDVLTAGLVWLGLTNGLLAAFNLLPGAPLDGGRVLQAMLWRRTGDRFRSTLTASRAGRVLGLTLVTLAFLEVLLTGALFSGIWLGLIGWFLVQAAGAEAHVATIEHDLRGVAIDDVMERSFATVASWQPVNAAARESSHQRCEYCAVVGMDGDLEGLLPVAPLLAAAKRGVDVKVREVTHRLPEQQRAHSGDDAATRLEDAGGVLPIAVLRDGHLEGIVTPASVDRAILLRDPPEGGRAR